MSSSEPAASASMASSAASERLRTLTAGVHEFLRYYYSLSDTPDPTHFVLESCESLGLGGQLLVRESQDGLEVGIQFGVALAEEVARPGGSIGPHVLGVVVEEVSHFLAIMQAASHRTELSPLDFEVLGEIDRFVVFAHAQDVLHSLAFELSASWPKKASFQDLCAIQFANRTFSCKPELTSTYVKAESVALAHLKKAFGHRWHNTKLDPLTLDREARRYFSNLRQAVTTEGHSVRLFLECA